MIDKSIDVPSSFRRPSTVTVGSIRRVKAGLPSELQVDSARAFSIEAGLEHTLLAFESANEGFDVCKALLAQHGDAISAGLITADSDADGTFSDVKRLASRISDIADAGQLLISLSTQELTRNQLRSGETFVDLGSRVLMGHLLRLFIFRKGDTDYDVLTGPKTLPWYPSRFVGRSQELDLLKQEILVTRLVSLFGPSGIGKTSLVGRLAAEIGDDYGEGVIWVDLSKTNRSSLLLHRIATVLEIPYCAEATLNEQIIRRLGNGSYLLVLDEIDNVLESVAVMAEEVLASCPNVTIISTSIKRLNTQSGKEIKLEGLECPSPAEPFEAARTYHAVQFFCESALSAYPRFSLSDENIQTIIQIVHRIDGSPWLIQMVASRMAVLSSVQILTRLKDDPLAFLVDRSRPGAVSTALRAVLGTLNPWTQDLYKRLWVFQGPFSAESVEAVCADHSVPKTAVLSCLKDLIEVQLIRHANMGSSRRSFSMGPLSREFSKSLSSLAERRTFSSHMSKYLKDKAKDLFSRGLSSKISDLEEFDFLYEDFRHQWVQNADHKNRLDEVVSEVMLCSNYWLQKMYFEEALEVLNFLARKPGLASTKKYLSFLNFLAWCNVKTGRYSEAKAILRSALRIALEQNDRPQIRKILNTCVALYSNSNRLRTGVRLARYAMTYVDGDEGSDVNTMATLAGLLANVGRNQEAVDLLREVERRRQGQPNWFDIILFSTLAQARVGIGDLETARHQLLHACELSEQFLYTENYPGLYLVGCQLLITSNRMYTGAVLLKAVKEINDFYGLPVVPRRKSVMANYAFLVGEEIVTSTSGWDPQFPLVLLKETLTNW